MKLLATILSIYILVINALPCIDVPPDHTLAGLEHNQTTNDSHQHEGDDCSPFCTCQCCATPVIFLDYTVHFKCFSYTHKQFSEYKPDYVSTISATIWQPPKIS